MDTTKKQQTLVFILVSIFLASQIVVFSWLSDDAFITMRSVDNFIHGFGPTWNIAERVQSFTHPLWMLLLTLVYMLIPNEIIAPVVLSLLFGLGTIIVVFMFHQQDYWAASLNLALLFLSQSFMHYVSSGLENPATNFLMSVFAYVLLNYEKTGSTVKWKFIFTLGIIAALGLLNRLDTGVFFGITLAYFALKNRDLKSYAALIFSMLPLAAWFIFSLIYYGFLFPNTAYAKLNTGIPTMMLMRQGVSYIIDSLQNDPITLFVITSAIVTNLIYGATREKLLATGLIGYLGYIVYIGGDFMSGRFFSGLFVVSSMLLCKLIVANRQIQGFVLALGFVLSLIAPYSPLKTLEQQPAQIINPATGIGNERAYYATTWLVNMDRNLSLREHKWSFEARYRGEKVPVIGGIGFYGFYAPRDLYIVDYFALTNPLLARLPIDNPTEWRIGHFERKIPDGYLDTIETGVNDISDPLLYEYYANLALITRGDLWSAERWQAIWAMNTGQYDYLIEHLHTEP